MHRSTPSGDEPYKKWNALLVYQSTLHEHNFRAHRKRPVGYDITAVFWKNVGTVDKKLSKFEENPAGENENSTIKCWDKTIDVFIGQTQRNVTE